MVWGTLRVLVLLAVLSPVRGNIETPDATSPFQYDWHRLRVTGLALAAVLCVIGIIVLLTVPSDVPCRWEVQVPEQSQPPPSPPQRHRTWLALELPPHAEASPCIPKPGGGGGEG
ncbi:FXYD domain-containing ion transport regulator 3-like [Falco naumanni]|uniref:FXYD domain-containing ion transport regulator 3-like n=1 Tax=Falco naumanni TaxID=148594 RepID=UPI001ADE9B95|nr:FXYD domain-containing ion transport regulator 3-like [Falco naumanni]